MIQTGRYRHAPASRILRVVGLAVGAVLALSGTALGQEWLTGYRLQEVSVQGPEEWRHRTEPIWVYEYHSLCLRYRAWRLEKNNDAVLTLVPGVVRPVVSDTIAIGRPVSVVLARDLIADGEEHYLEIELRGKMLTAQVDELIVSVPAGARLEICDLQFRADESVLPIRQGTPALPEDAKRLPIHGSLACGKFAATSLRGREAIRIDCAGDTGHTLYLSLMAHAAGLSGFVPGRPIDAWRVKSIRETADVIARVKYADGSEDEQFPFLVEERRYALLNRTAKLYCLGLDARPVSYVELLDRSPHVQLVLFAAGLSQAASPEPADEAPLPAAPTQRRVAGDLDLESSKWFQIEPAQGKTPPSERLRANLRVKRERMSRVLNIAVTNTADEPLDFTLVFPAVEARAAAEASDTYYLYPRQGAVISHADRMLEDAYGTQFPLQFLVAFSPTANQGACVIVRDTEGRFKTFRLNKHGTSVNMECRYPVCLAPGETYRAPESAVVLHGGDWRQGFAAYRQWLSTWYRPTGARPEWLRCAFSARRDYPIGGTGHLFDMLKNRYTFRNLIGDGEAFGGIDFIDISGWAQSDAVGRVGDYPIELGGADDLRRNIALAAASGIRTGLYFEGYLVDENSAVAQRFGNGWQMIDAAGRRMRYRPEGPEMYMCPLVPAWRHYLASRMAEVAAEVGAHAVYLDQFGLGGNRRCFASSHGHVPGTGVIPGEIRMLQELRGELDRAGLRQTMIYLEFNPVDAEAPLCDAAFCYAIQNADPQLSPAKLNLWRFAFPDIRLWDMGSVGVGPQNLSAEDFRLSLWHGNGTWLKGHSDTWYGRDLLVFLRHARGVLKEHAAAFSGMAEPLVASPHPAVLVNCYRASEETVYTLFNISYRTVRFSFQNGEQILGPRAVDVVVATK